MNHFINTSAVEPSRARTPSLISTSPQPFPVLFFGDVRGHSIFFHADGTIESFSGNVAYTLRVTLGDAAAGPFGGTYTLTCGTTTTALAFDATAQDVQDALNSLATVISEGLVTVEGSFPSFMIYANSVGVRTAITANAATLNPNSAITLEILTTGDASTRQETRCSLRRSVICSDDTWTRITSPNNGWTGSLTTNTEGAAALLIDQGELVGDFLQAQTLVTFEVIEVSTGNVVSYFQHPFFLRDKPTDLAATAATPVPVYQPFSSLLSAISAGTQLGNSTPASATATGTAGTWTYDSSFIYVCISTNVWRKVAIASW